MMKTLSSTLCALLLLKVAYAKSYASEVDVAVIGAGLAGLSAANDISRSGKSFLVVEARDRVGGRVENIYLPDGRFVEGGATFIGPTQDHAIALAKSLGLELEPTYDIGQNTIWQNGTKTHYLRDAGYPISGDIVQQGIETLDSMASELDVNEPWAHPKAAVWDKTNLQTWLDINIEDAAAQFFFKVFFGSILLVEAREVSLLYVISYIASAGNETHSGSIPHLMDTTNGAQENRVVGGTQRIAIELAKRLGEENIALGRPVQRVDKIHGGYHVTASGLSVKAKKIVVAMSPPLAAKIDFTPTLPNGRQELSKKLKIGRIGKAVAFYKTPFWRKHSLNGQAVADEGVVRCTFDVTPSNSSYGVMMGFIEADVMRRYDTESEDSIKAKVVKDYVRLWGPEAANVQAWVIKRWDIEEYSGGGPVAVGPPGVISKYGPFMSKPFEGIHFAGTESTPYWTGYMDGAIRSGERAAKDIISSLQDEAFEELVQQVIDTPRQWWKQSPL